MSPKLFEQWQINSLVAKIVVEPEIVIPTDGLAFDDAEFDPKMKTPDYSEYSFIARQGTDLIVGRNVDTIKKLERIARIVLDVHKIKYDSCNVVMDTVEFAGCSDVMTFDDTVEKIAKSYEDDGCNVKIMKAGGTGRFVSYCDVPLKRLYEFITAMETARN